MQHFRNVLVKKERLPFSGDSQSQESTYYEEIGKKIQELRTTLKGNYQSGTSSTGDKYHAEIRCLFVAQYHRISFPSFGNHDRK